MNLLSNFFGTYRLIAIPLIMESLRKMLACEAAINAH